MSTISSKKPVFTRYQVFMIALLSLLQFTVILDFMVMAPLGALLIRILHISPSQFGWVVSVYAFAAGVSGILAAGFADRFDRKKMLLVLYAGFIIGTFLCGIAPDYSFLLIARMTTGLFGGVMYSFNMAIAADLFVPEVRGRVMGYIQTSFAASQALGIPVGIFFATRYGWHMPFLIIVGICLVTAVGIIRWMKPMTAHLGQRAAQQPLQHLARTVARKNYLVAFMLTVFLSTGGFMIMPYSSAFLVRNVGVAEKMLTLVFFVAGVTGLFTGPQIGRLSDKLGKYRVFIIGSIAAAVMVIILTHLTVTPLWLVLVINTLMYTAVMSRVIPSQALVSGVPEARDRGAFMSINSSVQQLGGGVASIIGGWIIGQDAAGRLLHYDILGYVTVGAFVVCVVLMYFVNAQLAKKTSPAVSRPERMAVE
jgi:predicted MFS family arabinose efflux permease